MNNETDTVLLMGSGNPELAMKVGICLDMKVHQTISRFADNEADIEIPVDIKGKNVFIIQSTTPPFIDNHYSELLGIIDALKNFKAGSITAVVPYFGYSRSDRADDRQTSAMASVWAKSMEFFGADRIITVDLHSPATKDWVNIPLDNISARKPLIEAIREEGLADLLVISPDKGGVERATAFSRDYGLTGEVPYFEKQRNPSIHDKIKILSLVGEVEGKNILTVDDMLSTGETLIKSATRLIEVHKAKSIRAAVTHGIFSADALERLTNSVIEEVFITDSINVKGEVLAHPKVRIVSIAPLLAEAIKSSK